MADLGTRVKHALNEARMLVLGASVLLGFHYRGAFEPGFDRLSSVTQGLKLGGHACMLITIALLMAPAAFHQIVERGDDSPRLHRVATLVCSLALLPFAVAVGIDLFVAGESVLDRFGATVFGVGAFGLALASWYGVEMWARWRRGRRGRAGMERSSEADRTPLQERVEHVLTEARMVLPGAQALLGFQLAVMLTDTFEHLPQSSGLIHVVALAFIALTTILLMTPAAWHRLVEEGEDTERFHRIASVLVLAAMGALAIGLALDFFVVVRRVTTSTRLAVAAASVSLLTFYGLWFGLTAWARLGKRRRRVSRVSPRAA